MFGFGKKVEIKKLEINEAYRQYEKNPEGIMILCADEQKDFDALHMPGAECLPLRLMDDIEDYYPDKDDKYYVYAINPSISERAYKKLYKHGYDVYDLGSFIDYREAEEGLNARRKKRKKRR